MLLDVLLFLVGICLLVGGAWLLVTGGARIAGLLGVHPVVVGLTVVAWGTSAPELFVCLVAALRGSSDLMLGNVIGSNLANLGLILGLAALLRPVTVEPFLRRLEVPLLLAATVLFAALAWDFSLSRIDGIALLLVFGMFMIVTLRSATAGGDRARSAPCPDASLAGRKGILFNAVLVVLGVGGLTGSGHLIVSSALNLAAFFGVSEALIGLTMVAVGTSLPELATTIVASVRKEGDIALGNIVGSNLFNLLAVAGPVALIRPLSGPPDLRSHQLPGMILLTLLVPIVVAGRASVGRGWGLVLLLFYAGVLIWWLSTGV